MPLVLEPSPTVLAEEARGRLASLVPTDQMEPTERPEVCPKSRGRVVVELYSGQVFPDRCRSSQCAFCLPLNARRRCFAITYVKPKRMIMISVLANESDGSIHLAARKRIGLVKRNLKRMGIAPGEWCWTLEQNPEETGYHAHCLQRGRWIPQAELQEACVRAGAGIPYINKIKQEGIWTSRYGLKGFGANGYGLKGFRSTDDGRQALRINGGRMEHHSRGFFTLEGERIHVREVERRAIAEMNGATRTAYVGSTVDRAQSIVQDGQLRDTLIRSINRRTWENLRAMS